MPKRTPGAMRFRRVARPQRAAAGAGWEGVEMVNVGDKAPDFSLPSHSGERVSLNDFRGKMLVLSFFPKADTPG